MKSFIGTLFAMAPIRILMIACSKLVGAATGVINRAYGAYLWPDAANKNLYIYASARVKFPEKIKIGRNIMIGPGCVLGGMGGITLGDYVRMSEGACRCE